MDPSPQSPPPPPPICVFSLPSERKTTWQRQDHGPYARFSWMFLDFQLQAASHLFSSARSANTSATAASGHDAAADVPELSLPLYMSFLINQLSASIVSDAKGKTLLPKDTLQEFRKTDIQPLSGSPSFLKLILLSN